MNERDIFIAALQIDDDAQRNAYLDKACGRNIDLRRRVGALLGALHEAGSYLDEPAADPIATIDQPLTEVPGTQIGPYKLLQQIGEGGMGVVYMAEQEQPVRRRVALKIIKPGMDSRQVTARFEAERQALSLMDHPNIAKVLDAGTTDSGWPYFVMELVKGQPITQYCDEHHLTPRQRLELLLPVCRAIQHAHQKGIIHRDIKPTNILVAEYDQKAVPKVIDFGVAKAISQTLTEKTMFTGFGQIVGTLEYMSPEQAKVNQLDIDTRSDIYSLGVLLYELLTGSTPFDKQRLRSAAWDEMLRIIREEEPEKPSTRLSSVGTLPSIAANRSIEPARLSKLVRGELDWIVMKALEKDRNRRYETASNLAADLQRYLNDEPVQACPPSAAYRLRKFVRRNKGRLLVASVLGVAILFAVGTFGWAVRDRAARQSRIDAHAELLLGEADQLAKEQDWPGAMAAARRAETLTADGADAATQERVRQVLNDLQMVARLEDLRLREARAIEPEARFIDEVRSDLYAAAFRDFEVDIVALPLEESTARLCGRQSVAIALAAALDDWARIRRPKDPEQSKRLWALASALDPDAWRVKVRQASASMDVAGLVKLANAPEMAEQPPQSQLLLASSLRLGDQPEIARELLERASESHPDDFWIHFALALNSTARPDGTNRYDHAEVGVRHGIAARALRPRSAEAWAILGNALHLQEKQDEAIICFQKALELNPKSTNPYIGLGNTLRGQKKLDEAIVAYCKAIELNPKDWVPYSNLGNVLRDQKKFDEAIAAHQKAVEFAPKSAPVHINLGVTLRVQGRLDESIEAFRKAIELNAKDASAYHTLGITLHMQKKWDEAVAAYRKALELDPKFAGAYFSLGVTLCDQKKWAAAIACYKKATELDPKNASAYHCLGIALYMQNELDEAVAAYRKTIELDPLAATAYYNLGVALGQQKKLDEAVAAYTKATELDPNAASAYSNLGAALGQQEKLDEAVTALRKANELDPKDASVYINLGKALREQKKLDEAVTAFRSAIELDPKSKLAAQAYFWMGKTLEGQKKHAEALTCFTKAVELDPDWAEAHNALAWVLTNFWDPKLRDPKRGLEVARKAVALEPQWPSTWQMLGYACYRTGEWKGSVEALEKSIALQKEGDAHQWFFLAMAHWQLGEKDQARESYDRAVEWMDKNQPEKLELRRFRTEAAKLLELNDSKM